MMLEPNDLLLFARVADEGSFSRAAARVDLPKSTVSRRIATLEAQRGECLLLRTTRKLTLTDFGHSVLEHARQVAAEVDAAAQLAQHRQVEPSGRLRVAMPADLAHVTASHAPPGGAARAAAGVDAGGLRQRRAEPGAGRVHREAPRDHARAGPDAP